MSDLAAVDCEACGGDGWFVDHEDACYEDEDCSCSGVQVWCARCSGSGLGLSAAPETEVFTIAAPVTRTEPAE